MYVKRARYTAAHTVLIRTVAPSLLGQNPIIGHCSGTALVDTIAGMMNVQTPLTHGTTKPTAVIHRR